MINSTRLINSTSSTCRFRQLAYDVVSMLGYLDIKYFSKEYFDEIENLLESIYKIIRYGDADEIQHDMCFCSYYVDDEEIYIWYIPEYESESDDDNFGDYDSCGSSGPELCDKLLSLLLMQYMQTEEKGRVILASGTEFWCVKDDVMTFILNRMMQMKKNNGTKSLK